MRHRSLLIAVAILLSAASCAMDHGSGAGPAAPSGLTVALLSGGGHLTWKDNSDDETQFMVMRKEMGSTADFTAIATPTFNTTQYHDAPLTAGKTYLYTVMAMNNSGESDLSNEVTLAIP